MRLMRRLVLTALLVGATTVVARAQAQQTIKFATPASSAEELIIKLFKQAGENVIIEPVTPFAQKISVSLEGVPFEDALKRICESAGLASSKQGNVYVITCADRTSLLNRMFLSHSRLRAPPTFDLSGTTLGAFRSLAPMTFNQTFDPTTFAPVPQTIFSGRRTASVTPNAPNALVTIDGNRYFMASEERSTFACPHCKKSVTIVGKKGACAKCDRAFQQNWAYCPFDGTKRTLPLDEWKVCPFCTRGVK